MATVTYAWETATNSYTFNDLKTSGDQYSPAVVGLAKGGYFGAWQEPGTNGGVDGRYAPERGEATTSEFRIDTTSADLHINVDLAQLNNGRVVSVWTNFYGSDGDVQARILTSNGATSPLDFSIADGASNDGLARVDALADGGFVVSWTRSFTNGDEDIKAQIFDAGGQSHYLPIDVEVTSDVANQSDVAALADGSFIVAYTAIDSTLGTTNHEVWARHYSASGVPDDSLAYLHTDGDASQLRAIGLSNGGYALAWRTTEWSPRGFDLSVAFFDADGVLTNYTRANDETVAGDVGNPCLTELDNGLVVLAFDDGVGVASLQLYSATGEEIGDDAFLASVTTDQAIAGMRGGDLAVVRVADISDGSGNSIRTDVEELVRTTVGKNADETLNGDVLRDQIQGLGGKDKLSGFGGKDTLDGGDGNDVLRGGTGRDLLIGGAGVDTFSFSSIAQSRPGQGADVIKGFEHGVDRVDVGGVDAKASHAGDDVFHLIHGGFTGEGQVRAVQDGKDTILQFNTTGASGAEMEVVLDKVQASTITDADFVF